MESTVTVKPFKDAFRVSAPPPPTSTSPFDKELDVDASKLLSPVLPVKRFTPVVRVKLAGFARRS